MLGDSRLEYAVRLLLEDAECREVGERPIPLVENSEVEALVAGKGFVGDDLGSQEQMLLLSLLLLRLHLDTLLIQSSF